MNIKPVSFNSKEQMKSLQRKLYENSVRDSNPKIIKPHYNEEDINDFKKIKLETTKAQN